MRITVCALVGLVISRAAFAVPTRHLNGALYGREGKSPIARDATIPLLTVRQIGDATEKLLSKHSRARGRAGRDVPIAVDVARRSLDLSSHTSRSLKDRGDGDPRQPLARDPGIIFDPSKPPTSLTFGHIFRRTDDNLD